MISMLALMVFAHALADYPLQGAFMTQAKNRKAPVEGVPWYQLLGAHAVIHGGFVGIITGSVLLGCCEAVCHAAIDDAKCCGRIGFDLDQLLHLFCKLAWVAAISVLGPLP